jgi:hypothetical protein
MFKLFTKLKDNSVTTITEFKNSKNYPKEVLEIHHEFEIASDKLLENAYNIINSQPVVNESKLEKLQKFGFKQVKEVHESVEIIKTTSLSKEQIKSVQYYKQHYPFNKFITEPQVKEICHKYNLVCGDVGRFKGFVPDNNLKDIEKFKAKDQDILKEIWSIGMVMSYKGEELYDNGESHEKWPSLYKKESRNPSLQICAPIKDMDISGLELEEGYKLTRKLDIPDPVVLQPVNGGYLIITAWGDEASDPLVVNENFN